MEKKRECERAAEDAEAGFTIAELLVVLGIIALIASLVGPQAVRYFAKAKSDTAEAQLRNLESAIELYYLDNGQYPTSEQNLDALVEAPTGLVSWNGPYLRRLSGLSDPWGSRFQYVFPGENGVYDLFSLGRDRKDGGDGEDRDIVNW